MRDIWIAVMGTIALIGVTLAATTVYPMESHYAGCEMIVEYESKADSIGVTARIWQDMSLRDQNIYVEGVLDGFILSYGMSQDPRLAWAHKYIERGMSARIIVEKIRVYLNQHPEMEYIIMTMVVRDVLVGMADVE